MKTSASATPRTRSCSTRIIPATATSRPAIAFPISAISSCATSGSAHRERERQDYSRRLRLGPPPRSDLRQRQRRAAPHRIQIVAAQRRDLTIGPGPVNLRPSGDDVDSHRQRRTDPAPSPPARRNLFPSRPVAGPVPVAEWQPRRRRPVHRRRPHREAGSSPNLRWYICGLLFFATTINYIDRQVIELAQAGRWKRIWAGAKPPTAGSSSPSSSPTR